LLEETSVNAATLLGVTRWKLGRMITRIDLREYVMRIRNVAEDGTQPSVAGEAAPEPSASGHDSR